MRTKSEIAAYQKSWVARNRNKARAASRRWKLKNPEKLLEYKRRWYLKYHAQNLLKAKNRTLRRKSKQREWIRNLKEKTPCADCKNYYPGVCMDFDHLPGKGKTENVGRMPGKPDELIQQEIDKCEIVCANCHRIRTNARRLRKHKNPESLKAIPGANRDPQAAD